MNNDGKLSLEEYKLNSMKEPMIIDFLSQFLADQTDSGANSICSALSVPPSPRSGSSPPSPRFSHFAPPSPRLRDSLYGTATGHVLQTSSPAGSFRLSNSHSLLWLNGGINGSGDLLGKVNEFEGLVAAEEEQKKERIAAEKETLSKATAAVTVAALKEEASSKTEGSDSKDVSSPVDIVVVPSEDSATTETTVPSETEKVAEEKSSELKENSTEKTSTLTNGHSAKAMISTAATLASDEIREKEEKHAAIEAASKSSLAKAEENGALEVAPEPVEDTTAKLEIQQS